MNRRNMLGRSAAGIGSVALASMLTGDSLAEQGGQGSRRAELQRVGGL